MGIMGKAAGTFGEAFRDKTVWITGASSGIGEALARELGAGGARVILSARRADRLLEIAATIPQARVLPLDLAQPDTLEQKAQEALTFFGGLDMIVHNGGLSQRSRAAETPLAHTRHIMEVNFFSTVILTQAVLPALRASRGTILVISSIIGKFGAPGRSTYAASKHALHGYYEAVRAEETDLQVTLVNPGFIRTEVSAHALHADGTEHGKIDPGQEKGMSADECARRILRGVSKGKDEMLVGGLECGGVLLKRWAPWLLTRILRGRNVDG